eukprot:985032_1
MPRTHLRALFISVCCVQSDHILALNDDIHVKHITRTHNVITLYNIVSMRCFIAFSMWIQQLNVLGHLTTVDYCGNTAVFIKLNLTSQLLVTDPSCRIGYQSSLRDHGHELRINLEF